MPADPTVSRLLEEILESGSSPEEVCRSCPELLPQVRERWLRIRSLEIQIGAMFPASTASSASSAATRVLPAELPQIPGYEVQEVLGYGGMGVVYKAWHKRLNRAVALKMMLSGAYARPEELKRFFREAESLAALRHPNIVDVYDVGDFDGRPYFTMEHVEGGSLAQKLASTPQPPISAAAFVATLAAAVHTAHQRGIVHRDLKPANVLLTADGTPKISDFGLARRMEGNQGLTTNGLPMGTPNYMAPEQAQGTTSEIGPGTDVYALGAILYELLTGRPPFRADSSAATLRQVVSDEPAPPARLNPRVPRDLETICLMCLDKEPTKRYASAQALADDLRAFERGEPIAARPLGHVARLARWARRRPTAAALAGALLVTAMLALVLVGGGLWLSGQRQATAQAAKDDLREAHERLQQSDLAGARAALERAKGRLGTSGPPDLQEHLAHLEAALTLHLQLDAICLRRTILHSDKYEFTQAQSDRDYEAVFRSAGLGTDQEQEEIVAARVSGSPAHKALVAALDDWADCTRDKRRRGWLLKVARRADPDPWRDQVRDPAPEAWTDRARLAELARTAPVAEGSVQLLVVLGNRLRDAAGNADAVAFLRRVQVAHPADFYANFLLGDALFGLSQFGDAAGYFRAALAVRPDAILAWDSLGWTLLKLNRWDEARVAYEQHVRIAPDDGWGHEGLGEALRSLGQTDQAIDHLQRAAARLPRSSRVHRELARALQERQRWGEAIDHFRAAATLQPDAPWLQYDLGMALNSPGHQDEAIEYLRKTLALDPHYPEARANLIRILLDRGRADEAIAELRQALALEPRNASARTELRNALTRLGRWPEVRAAWREELDANPPEHDAWFGYAELCLFLGDEPEYRRACRDLLTRFGDTKSPQVAERCGRSCLLLPEPSFVQSSASGILARPKDQLGPAVALIDRAISAGRQGNEFTWPYSWFAKGLAEYRMGRFDRAISLMSEEAREASKMRPDQLLISAMAQFQLGQKDKARSNLAAAVVSYDWSAAKADSRDPWIAHILRREAEALILPNLPAFLNGTYQPQDNEERLALLGTCQFKELRTAEAGLLAAAFATDPKPAENLDSGLRYRAARAAAVAGCGGGADGAALSEPERARWRQQARAWLRADLAVWAKRRQAAKPTDRGEVPKALARWRDDPDLAGLRDPDALNRLPPAERQEWRVLWQKAAEVEKSFQN
jgi:eukaryotic-like serine/threonine-protein kinase